MNIFVRVGVKFGYFKLQEVAVKKFLDQDFSGAALVQLKCEVSCGVQPLGYLFGKFAGSIYIFLKVHANAGFFSNPRNEHF